MPRFFNRIRKQLAKENRFFQYSRYAVGEILLVVIGILIALQVDSWNEDRKKRSESIEIRNALIYELSKDTLEINWVISRLDSLKGNTSNLIDRWYSESANFDSLVNIAQDFIPDYTIINDFNNSTYQSISSSGKIGILNMDIQKKLVSLNKLQTESLDDDNALHYNAILREYLLSYPLGKPNNSYASKLVWEITNRKDFAQKFIFMCIIKNFVLEQYHSHYRETLVATKELIAELNMHSNSK